MKHYFHIMVAGALLLGSLIIFDTQKRECSTQFTDAPDIEHLVLHAEIASNQHVEFSAFSNRYKPEESFGSISGNLNHPEYLNVAVHHMRIKTQMLIFLELKPSIGFQSSPYHNQHSGSDDPPVA